MIIRGYVIKKILKLPSNINDPISYSFLQNSEKAFQQGEEKGYNLAKKELSSAFFILNKLSQNLISRLQKLSDELKPELINLCIHICEKIILQKLTNSNSIRSLLENIINQSFQINNQVFHITLSKKDFDILSPLIQKHQAIIGKKNTWEIDLSLSPGSYRIHTKKKLISYHLHEELFLLKQSLLHNA